MIRGLGSRQGRRPGPAAEGYDLKPWAENLRSRLAGPPATPDMINHLPGRRSSAFRLLAGSLSVLAAVGVTLSACAQTGRVQVAFSERLGRMDMDRMALGQGGLSDQPMWADRIP